MKEQQPSRTLFSYETEEEERLARTIASTMYRYDRIAENRIATWAELTDKQIRLFWETGYLIVEQALTEAEVKTSIEAIMDIIAQRSLGSRIQFVKSEQDLDTEEKRELAARKIYDFMEHEPRLRAIALHKEVMGAVSKLLGEEAKVVQDQCILKPPFGGAEKPWHQDMAYGNLAYDKMVIGAWFALDPAELDNGCMHIIPGSHREGAVPHYAVRDWQLCDTSIAVPQEVAVPLLPGGVLLFSGLLHHGTPPNFSEKRRRSAQIHYAPESAVKLRPHEYKRMFTNEMTRAQC